MAENGGKSCSVFADTAVISPAAAGALSRSPRGGGGGGGRSDSGGLCKGSHRAADVMSGSGEGHHAHNGNGEYASASGAGAAANGGTGGVAPVRITSCAQPRTQAFALMLAIDTPIWPTESLCTACKLLRAMACMRGVARVTASRAFQRRCRRLPSACRHQSPSPISGSVQ